MKTKDLINYAVFKSIQFTLEPYFSFYSNDYEIRLRYGWRGLVDWQLNVIRIGSGRALTYKIIEGK